ncbi:hypothetical protein LJR118_004441 [Acidovorax sp. LjRoot118]|uniref:hypothetical protein n=1 Tax=unclassified Acidovorax TaxID=2684926 RepID=UPI000A595845|nr:hypothetical protein [Acidovorax sp. Root217]
MTTQPGFFQQSKKPHLQPGRRVLLLVGFINPMEFPGAENLVPAALQAAHATA